MHAAWPLLLATLAAPTSPGPDTQAAAITTPAPVSGKSLAQPESITIADALARLNLVRDNLELIRLHMGRYPARKPLFRATRASVIDTYYEGVNLRRRLSRLVYEALRVDVPWRIRPDRPPRPFEMFTLMDGALAEVLRIKRSLGIDRSVAERAQSEDATAIDLFRAVTETGALVDALLDKKTHDRDAFLAATIVAHHASQLHVALTDRFLPDEPQFVPGKTPEEVLAEVQGCFELVSQLAKAFEVDSVEFTVNPPTDRRQVTPDDVLNLFILMMAELDRIALKAGFKEREHEFFTPGLKYPAHVFQRTRLIKAILRDLLAVHPNGQR